MTEACAHDLCQEVLNCQSQTNLEEPKNEGKVNDLVVPIGKFIFHFVCFRTMEYVSMG